jgi:hypothetical protein
MKIALLDAHDKNYDDIGALSDANRVTYCEKQNLDFIRYRFAELEPQGRQPNWGKVQGILKHLPDYDWIFYLDTDAIITNMNLDVREYIDENYPLIAGIIPEKEGGHLSTGALLIKNCSWSYEFLQDLWNQTRFIEEPWFGTHSGGDGMYFEQSAFHYLYDIKSEYREKIKVITRVAFNSQIYFYEPDHLLVHFPGRGNKEQLMRLCLDGKYQEAKQAAISFDARTEKIKQKLTTPMARGKIIGKPKL